MSAWPEAVYVTKQIAKLLNLDKRVLKLQNKLYVFAKQTTDETTGAIIPDLEEEYDFSNDSVWFVQKDDDPNKIFAVSVFSQTLGWSSFINFSPDSGDIDFAPATQTGPLANVDNVEDALNALSTAIGSIVINDATKQVKGIVRIGDNINVSDGTISVSTATASTLGVMKLYNDSTNSNTDGTMTQAAIKAAIGKSALSSEDVTITAVGWSDEPTGEPVGSDIGYYVNQVSLSSSYGLHPTISLIAGNSNDVPTRDEIEAFNNIRFAMVNSNQIIFYAKFLPDIDLHINVKV